MKTLKKQQGLTMWGWLVVLSMVGVLATQFAVLFTPYTNYFTLESISESIAADQKLKGKKSIIDAFKKKTKFNDVPNFVTKDTLSFKKTKSGVVVFSVKYEQRVNLFKTLDFVVVFEQTYRDGGS